MAPQKRKDKPMVLLKSLVLIFLFLSFFGVLSCNGGSNSTTSSGSGTGAGWTITIQVGTNPLAFGGTTTIMATVRDRAGAPVPMGTTICFTAVINHFLEPGQSTPYATVCATTLNDLGQISRTYYANSSTGDDIVEVSSQGVIARVILTVL